MGFKLSEEDFRTIAPFLAEGQHQSVIDYLASIKDKYITSTKPILRAAYFYTLLRSYSKLGKYVERDQCAQAALGAYPYSFIIRLEVANSYMQQGQLKNAQEMLRELSNDPFFGEGALYVRFLILYGRYFKLMGDYKTAQKYFTEAQSSPKNITNLLHEIKLMNMLEAQSLKHPKRIEGCRDYSYRLFRQDRNAKPMTRLSVIFMQNILNGLTDPSDQIQCLDTLTYYAMELGDISAAKNFNEQALELDKTHPRSLALQIRLLLKEGSEEDAKKLYTLSKPTITKDHRGTVALAGAFHEAGLSTIAKSLVKAVLKKDYLPDDIIVSAQTVLENIRGTAEIRQPA